MKLPGGVLEKLVSKQPGGYQDLATRKANQIIFIGLRSSKDFYRRPSGVVGVCGKGHFGVNFLRGSMCARCWVRWILRGTGTAGGHPGVF